MSEHNKLTGPHYGLAAIQHAALRNCLGNRCLNVPTTTLEAGDKNDIETQSVAIIFSIGGKNYSASALADENVTNTDFYGDDPIQAKGTTCYYAICIASDDTITGYKGQDDGDMPAHPADLCCFCVIKVVTTSAVTFELGVTDYDAANVTSSFTDVSFLPLTAP